MDDTSSRASSKKKNTASERARVRSRAADPYEEDGIPPFDDTPVEPIRDAVGSSAKKKTGQTGRSSSAGRTKKTTAASNSQARRSSGRSRSAAAKEDKPLPAEIAYRMQPYLVLGVGALLVVMLALSAIMSGLSFDWTSATHPFRWVGYHLEGLLFGLFGYGTYLLAPAMIYLSVCHLRDSKHYRSHGRGFLAFGICVLFPAIIHALMIDAGAADGALNTWAVKSLYALGMDHLGGGVLGGLLGKVAQMGLGPVGTVIVGGVLLVVLLMLFFRLTPSMIWGAICRARDNHAERVQAYRERAEAREERDAAAREQAKALPAPSKRTRGASVTPAQEADKMDTDEEAEYLDPTRALLEQGKKKNAPVQDTAPYDAYDMYAAAEPTPVEPAPIETVRELGEDEIAGRERAFAMGRSVASVMDEAAEEESDAGEPILYPGHAEIDLDEEGAVSPLELPVEEQDYSSGFDYSMEGAENDDVVEGTEVIGGVSVKVDKLSDEERARGAELAPDEQEDLPRAKPYVYPTVDLLNEPKPHNPAKDQEIRAKMQKLHATLTNFKVQVAGMSYVVGPAVTRYEVRPAPGVRVRAIANLADDIAMSLAAKSIRIEAPIPGKEAVGIEVPNTTRETVYLRRLIDTDEFRNRPSKLTACLGEDVAGEPIVFDIVKMPHLLVAGTTGSGKSVCINDFLMSLVYKSSPAEVKIILIDPKQVEFTVYKDLPHLMAPIVCEPKRAAAALNLAVLEMEKRFQMIRDVGVRDIAGYNAITENDRYEHPYMPHIVIVIDELADLMMQAKDEVETSIVRLAQKARAAGMHLIIGTQRPSVDVITGLIKANIPSRIACTVVSQVDSRTILDMAGAEKLLGMGDMLYAPVGSPKPLRVQGAFVSDGEVERIVDFIKRNNDPVRYDQEFLDNLDREAQMIGTKRQADMDDDMGEGEDGSDPKFYEALKIAVDNNRISTSLLQRMLSIGYGRAAKIIDEMERRGYVGPAVGNKPREIRITKQEYAELIMNKED